MMHNQINQCCFKLKVDALIPIMFFVLICIYQEKGKQAQEKLQIPNVVEHAKHPEPIVGRLRIC